VGRLTREPETTYAQSGTCICKFTIAVDDRYKKEEPKANFIPVTVFGKQAESCGQYLGKGRLVSVEGRWTTGRYEKDGRTVYTNDLIADDCRFLDRWEVDANRGEQQQSGNDPFEVERTNQRDPFEDDGKPIDISDDDLPF
jgi:single-strand DNA-binding protein